MSIRFEKTYELYLHRRSRNKRHTFTISFQRIRNVNKYLRRFVEKEGLN